MTLKNLLGIGLDVAAPDRAHIGKLLAAAERNIADAKLHGLSTENRKGTSISRSQSALLSFRLSGNSKPVPMPIWLSPRPATMAATTRLHESRDRRRASRRRRGSTLQLDGFARYPNAVTAAASRSSFVLPTYSFNFASIRSSTASLVRIGLPGPDRPQDMGFNARASKRGRCRGGAMS